MFCQTENDIPTIKELQKANGKIKIESFYPVDTSTFSSTNTYLDSNFKITNRTAKVKYLITQNVAYDWWKFARICKRRPYKILLDSLETIKKDFNLSIQYARLYNAQIYYKRFFSAYEYKLENGVVTKISQTNRKGTKIKILFDYSGLYLEKNKTWPTNTVYRKNGSVKRVVRELYYNKNIYGIIWKPD